MAYGPHIPYTVLRMGPTTVQVAASADSVLTMRVPFKCRIVEYRAGVEAIGGTTDPTDVDIDLENGTTDIGDPVAAVGSSAIVSGGSAAGTPDSGQDNLVAGDIIHMDIDITGGASPTVDGVWAELIVVRE